MERKEVKVLDKGLVALIDVMGDDNAVVQAARVSYGEGTKTVNDDRNLIRYMMRNRHTSVFEMVSFKFHVKAPIFVFRQWHRHRTSKINELSARYSEMKDECYVPELSRLQKQSNINKQGSGEVLNNASWILGLMKEEQESSFSNYYSYLEEDLARELSRINLPVSTYSEMYWKMDLHNLFHFIKLRMNSHSQYEIRVYANAIYDLIKPIVPISCEAFEDYVLNANTFSGQEMEVLKSLIDTTVDIKTLLKNKNLSKREITEFLEKMGLAK